MSDVVGSGRVVAPSGAAVIATIAAVNLPKGRYDIVVTAHVSGAAAGDDANMALNVNGAALVSPVPHGVSGIEITTTYKDEVVDGINPVTVTAIGAGTASIVYGATIEATRVSAQ